jgi:hypothetical protein
VQLSLVLLAIFAAARAFDPLFDSVGDFAGSVSKEPTTTERQLIRHGY